ncbi:MAG: domain S-box protein [Verrucomicrobiaceae bacterium]|nr:domain S-box protein [Verrucomicrobiaceae bacterium]
MPTNPQLTVKKNLRILVVDDNRAIHDDFRKILCPSNTTGKALDATEAMLFGSATVAVPQTQFEVDSAYQGQDAVKMVQKALGEGRPYAMAFVDIRMPPGWDGIETTQRIWELDRNLQVVICTAYSDYSWGEMFAILGHSDGLLILKKPFDTVEALQFAHALTEKRWLQQQSQRQMEELERMVVQRTNELQHTNEALHAEVIEHTRAEEELQSKTAFLVAQVNCSLDGILVVDKQGKKTLQNQRMTDMFKMPKAVADDCDDATQLRWVTEMIKNREQFVEKVRHLYAHPDEVSRDEIDLNDGTILDRYSAPVVGKDGEYYGRIWTFRDITERRQFEARLFQSQKLETVGKLAGGIAHEFNSILTAIMGQSELLLGDLPPASPLIENVNEINTAAGRAATLTRQLLAYGRKQFLQTEVLDLNRVIAGMKDMLPHLMGDTVDTHIAPGPGLQAVQADAGQVEQVIMNMAINAREAMPHGGKLTVETANISFDLESVGRYPELKPGNYVMLAITDTGAGMSDEVKARAFEPFFTTKGLGGGTGLGLSTCYGIVKQSGGHVSVYSEKDRGTTFKVYLPQIGHQEKAPAPRLDAPGLPRGAETILLVEDDPALREMATSLLRRLGYTVLAAANGVEALGLGQHPETGHVERVQALYPQTRILFTSAYTETAMLHQGALNKGFLILQKPFTPSGLAHKLREVLDQPAATAPDLRPDLDGLARSEL